MWGKTGERTLITSRNLKKVFLPLEFTFQGALASDCCPPELI